jgi:hypothetical protein
MNSAATKKFFWAGCLTAGITVSTVLFFCDPVRVPIYPVCLFHRVTGLDCPGCGSLRALHELLHGNFAAALHFNAFLVLSLPVFAWLGFRLAARRMKNEPVATFRPVWLWLYLAAFVTFGILRDLPVPFFAAFAP